MSNDSGIPSVFVHNSGPFIRDFHIEMKDFGPLSGGRICLKPLTVFVGENNTGKSYSALLLHSIFEAIGSMNFLEKYLSMTYRKNIFMESEFSHLTDDLWELVEEGDWKDGMSISGELLNKIINIIIGNIFESSLVDFLVRHFAVPLKDLRRVGKRTFNIKILWKFINFNVKYKKESLSIEDLEIDKIDIKINPLNLNSENRRDKEFFCKYVFGLILEALFKSLGQMSSYYLPSSRSGILQNCRVISASMLKYDTEESFPRFPGIIRDFLGSLLSMTDEIKGTFYDLAVEMEKEMTQGAVVLKPMDMFLSPEIRYHFQNIDIPIYRASSSVCELSPLILYLKYVVKPGSILILEEPEAHLHPRTQQMLAKYIVRLVRKGVLVLITTHSEHLLQNINRRSQVEGLSQEDLGLFMFHEDPRLKGGYRISQGNPANQQGMEDIMNLFK